MNLTYRADAIYGATGTGKTSQVGEAALYYFNKTGKRTRLVTADPGGYAPLDHLIEEQIIEVWPLAGWPDIVWNLDCASQGKWPEDPFRAGSKLVEPTSKTWEQYALLALEGLTSFGDAILQHLMDKKARLSQDPSYVFLEGQGTYSGGNMTYYGFVQSRLHEFVVKSQTLPFQKVIWTALEGRGEEEGTKTPTFGPSIAGKKSVGKAGQWFGNLIHLEQAVREGEKNKETQQVSLITKPVMYLRSHAEPTSRIPFPAKTRAPLGFSDQVPEYLDPPSLGRLYDLLDSLKQKARAKVSADKSKAPQPTIN